MSREIAAMMHWSPERNTRGVARERDGQVDPHDRAVLAHVALLEVRRVELARAHARPWLVGDIAIRGVRDVLHGATDQLLGGIAEHAAKLRVGAQQAPLEID